MKMNKGVEFPKAPAGLHQAVCYGVVDIGTQKQSFEGKESLTHQCVLLFEYANLKLDDGRHMVQSAFYTMSLGDQANLYKHIKSWFGKTMSKDEKAVFDSSSLIGKNCVLQIIMNKNDKPKIETILPLMEGMSPHTAENPKVDYELTPGYIPEDMYDWLADKIKASEEWNNPDPSENAPDEVSDVEPF
jgi:hypothetical protein